MARYIDKQDRKLLSSGTKEHIRDGEVVVGFVNELL